MIFVPLQRLPGGDEAGERQAGARAAGVAVQTVVMQVGPADDLVTRRDLPRQADGVVLPHPVVFGLLGEIRQVGPFGVVTGVLVVPDAGNRLPVVLVAVRGEEPEPVALDRAAE